ncbi:hypothetical protein LWI29_000750 [Acer saccharum]|uniref:Uncharacterized protein n=1 Tax=Acer saccharum TaxID=4024 RepID=A0AA39RPI7_ACESA|nr:hypothetical protein LWI29_000750 [Acer saccharum]
MDVSLMASGRPCLGRPITTRFFPFAFLLMVERVDYGRNWETGVDSKFADWQKVRIQETSQDCKFSSGCDGRRDTDIRNRKKDADEYDQLQFTK